MNQYIVIGRAFDIPANSKVELTVEQYLHRKHAVKPLSPLPEKWEKAVFETLQPIQFKRDEQIGTDISIGKSQQVKLIPVQLEKEPAAKKK